MIFFFQKKDGKTWRVEKNGGPLHSQIGNGDAERGKKGFPMVQGRLAQLVQSICLTSRGSAVRIRQRPRYFTWLLSSTE